MFAYGRNMYSLSRAGYYPKFFSLTGKRQTPWVALIVGAVHRLRRAHRARLPRAVVEGRRCGRRRDHPEHRGLGCRARVRPADGVVHHPAPEVPERRRAPTRARGVCPAPAIARRSSPRSSSSGFLLNPTFQPAIIAIVIVYVVILVGFAVWGATGSCSRPRRSTRSRAACTATRRRRATTRWRPRSSTRAPRRSRRASAQSRACKEVGGKPAVQGTAAATLRPFRRSGR